MEKRQEASSSFWFLIFCQKLQLNPREHISGFGSSVLNGNAFCSTPGIHWIPFISTQHESLENWLAYVNTESTSRVFALTYFYIPKVIIYFHYHEARAAFQAPLRHTAKMPNTDVIFTVAEQKKCWSSYLRSVDGWLLHTDGFWHVG